MMSVPAMNHVQYRFKAEGSGTRLLFTHRAAGLIMPEHKDGMDKGLNFWMERIRDLAQRKKG